MKRKLWSLLLCLALCFSFSVTAFATPDPTWASFPVQKKGGSNNQSKYVKVIQRILMNYDMYTHDYIYDASLSGCGIDGSFGTDTDLAVRHIQHVYDLAVDGSVGPNTWHLLRYTLIHRKSTANGFNYYSGEMAIDANTNIIIRQGTTSGNWGSRPWGVSGMTSATSWNVFSS